jgi:aspartate aminotransferase-like enzyme
MRQFRLPGPVELHQEVYEVLGKQLINHRGDEYADMLWRIINRMKMVYQTKNDILMLNCSGKGALEAVVANLFNTEDSILVLSNGYFGYNLRKMVRSYCHIVPQFIPWSGYRIEPGGTITPSLVQAGLEEYPSVRAVYIVHCETSTGVVNPIKEIGEVARKHDKLFIVDGVSSVGGIDIKTDKWGVDVLVTASQKAIGAPPGVSFVSLSERAWHMYTTSELPKFYWDFGRIREVLMQGRSFSTPPLPTIFGLDKALSMIADEGLENVFQRHTRVAETLWKTLEDIGYELFIKNMEKRSHTVTSVKIPNGIGVKKLLNELKYEHSVEFAPGLSELKDKIFRIGHMGCVTEKDIESLREPLALAIS